LVRSVAVLALLAAGRSRARAQDLTPAEDQIRDQLIADAKEAHHNHDHAHAKELAQKALRMRATPSLQELAAREASETGDFAFAYLTGEKCLLEANRDANLPDKDRLVKACTSIVAKVKGKIAYVVVKVADVPRNARITIAGQELHEAALGSPYVVNPGDIKVEADAPDYQSFERDLHVSVTETKQVSITLSLKRRAAAPDEPKPAPEEQPGESSGARGASGGAIKLDGTWRATYQCPLGVSHDELVRIAQHGRSISATKLTGDDCVPAGTVSWQGALSRLSFSEKDLPLNASVRVTVADARARRQITGSLTVAEPDRLVVTVGGVAMDFLRDTGGSASAEAPPPQRDPGYPAPAAYSIAIFPSVPEVRQRVLSRDPIDMMARHAATFAQLIKVVYVVAGNALGPQEQNLVQAYTAAMRDADQRGEALLARSMSASARRGGAGAVATQWFGLRARYDNDGYREQMLFFFSPELRVAYQARRR
jgi:hypothetical protein